MLARHGYGVLLFDRRGEGASEGDGNSFGWGGERDIYAAAAYLRSRPEVDDGRIGGLGLSVGGELMLQAAAESNDLAAVISEGGGTRTFSEDVQAFDGVEKWAGMPFLVVKTAAVALFANRTPPPALSELVRRIAPTPLFLIWSPEIGGENLNERYYRLARQPKSIWAVPGAEHTRGIEARPREYERRVIAFLDRALEPSTAGRKERPMTTVAQPQSQRFARPCLAAPQDGASRSLLLAPPLALAALEVLHPAPDINAQAVMDVATWFALFHAIQLVLIGLVGLSVFLLADRFGRATAWTTRLGVGAFLVFYSAYDAIAGISTGLAMRNARDLPAAQQEGVW